MCLKGELTQGCAFPTQKEEAETTGQALDQELKGAIQRRQHAVEHARACLGEELKVALEQELVAERARYAEASEVLHEPISALLSHPSIVVREETESI